MRKLNEPNLLEEMKSYIIQSSQNVNKMRSYDPMEEITVDDIFRKITQCNRQKSMKARFETATVDIQDACRLLNFVLILRPIIFLHTLYILISCL